MFHQKFGKFEIGEKTEMKFLTGLIPEIWIEEVYESNDHYSVIVIGEKLTPINWDHLTKILKDEFGNDVMEIYSMSPCGLHFVIHLKKNLEK